MPTGTLEDDLLQGFRTRWEATTALQQMVPEGPTRGTKPSPQPALYCQLDCQALQPREDSSNGSYVVWRQVLLTVRGPYADVVRVLGAVDEAYTRKVFAVPNSTLMACLLADDAHLEEDPARKSGEDVWIGQMEYHVTVNRQTPAAIS